MKKRYPTTKHHPFAWSKLGLETESITPNQNRHILKYQFGEFQSVKKEKNKKLAGIGKQETHPRINNPGGSSAEKLFHIIPEAGPVRKKRETLEQKIMRLVREKNAKK